MRKKSLIAVLTAALILAGCGESYSSYATTDAASGIRSSYASYNTSEGSYEESEYASDSSVEDSGIKDVDTSKKIVRNMDFCVETTDLASLEEVIQSKVAEMDGYIQYASTSGNESDIDGYYLGEDGNTYYDSSLVAGSGYHYRSAFYTVRIPVEKLDQFAEAISGSANVTSQTTTTEDITTSYIDVDSQRKTLEEEEQILNEMMSKAETIEDMIQIEDKLSEVRGNLQNIKSQLKAMDNEVAYSTVTIDVTEVTVLSNKTSGSWIDRVSSGFVSSCKRVAENFVDLTVFVLANLPMLAYCIAVLGVCILVVYGFIRLVVKICSRKKVTKNETPKKTDDTVDASSESGENHA